MTLRLFRRCRRRLYRCHRLVVVVKVVFIAVIVVVVVVVFIVVIVVVVKVNASTQNASKLIGIRQRGSSYAVRVLADRRGGLPSPEFRFRHWTDDCERSPDMWRARNQATSQTRVCGHSLCLWPTGSRGLRLRNVRTWLRCAASSSLVRTDHVSFLPSRLALFKRLKSTRSLLSLFIAPVPA